MINEEEKMYKQYKLVFILAILTIIIFSFFFAILYPLFIQNIDDRNYKKFLAGGPEIYLPKKHDLTWYQNVIFNQINELSFEKNVILIGGSTTSAGVLPDYNLTNNWTLYNFGMAANTVYSDKIMLNYIDNYANHKLNKNDVVIFHIWHAYFVDTPPESDFTRQVIENSGIYRVDDSGNITGHMTNLQKILVLKKFQANFFYSMDQSKILQSTIDIIKNLDIPNKSSNNLNLNTSGPNEQTLKEYEKGWSDYTRNTTYPNNSTAEFEELILQVNNQTNVVIVNLYTPSWLHNSSKEQEYERWLESDLRPFLEEEHIPWIDFSSSIPDSEYGDSAHLFKSGRERYTKLFNNEINKILFNITTNQLVEKKWG